MARESASQSFDDAARALRLDWGVASPDGRQVQRWGEALGRSMVRGRGREGPRYREGSRPAPPANEPQLLVIGPDGGRHQGRGAEPDTRSRWREDKVLTVSSCPPGDGARREPEPLVTTHVATARDAHALGEIARVEVERRGCRRAAVVVGMGDRRRNRRLPADGGNWIDPPFDRASELHARVIDWCHAAEHVWDRAKAAHAQDGPRAAQPGERLGAPLRDGRAGDVVATPRGESQRLGDPRDGDPPGHPRRVPHQNVGYFTRHAAHMNYPAFRRRGRPVGSGVTEAGVKQLNKRVKGTEQFRSEAGVETILSLRGAWISQDERWERYWATRDAYVK